MLQEEVAATKASQGMDDDATNKGDNQGDDDVESSSSHFGLAAPKARMRTKSKPSKPNSKPLSGSPLKPKPTPPVAMPAELGNLKKATQAIKSLEPSLIWKGSMKDAEIKARFKKAADVSSSLEKEAVSLEEGSETAQAVRRALNEATEVTNNAQIVHEVLGKLRGIKQVLPLLQNADFAAELTKAFQVPAMDADTLATILSYLASKVAAEAGFNRAYSTLLYSTTTTTVKNANPICSSSS